MLNFLCVSILNSWEYPLMVQKRCLRQLFLPKRKLGQLPFAVTREWNLNIVYGLYYGKDFFFF